MEFTLILFQFTRKSEALIALITEHAPAVKQAIRVLRGGQQNFDEGDLPKLEELEELEEQLYSYFEMAGRFAGNNDRSLASKLAEEQLDLLRPILSELGRLIRALRKAGDGREAIEEHERSRASRVAAARWSRLLPVKQLAFQRRQEMAELSRPGAIKKMLPEILAAAREAKEPLTGGDPVATITRWLREAGIK